MHVGSQMEQERSPVRRLHRLREASLRYGLWLMLWGGSEGEFEVPKTEVDCPTTKFGKLEQFMTKG